MQNSHENVHFHSAARYTWILFYNNLLVEANKLFHMANLQTRYLHEDLIVSYCHLATEWKDLLSFALLARFQPTLRDVFLQGYSMLVETIFLS